MSAPDPRTEPAPWTTAQVARYYAVRPARVLAWVREGRLSVARCRPGRHGAYLFHEKDVLALDAQGRDVNPADVAAIIDAELRQRRTGRRGA